MSKDRARQILLDAFWDAGSWRRSPAIAPDEFDIAKAAGFMFDPGVSTHADAVTHAINTADLISSGFLKSPELNNETLNAVWLSNLV